MIYEVLMANEYGEVVFSGTKDEIAKFLNITHDHVNKSIHTKSLVKTKYNIVEQGKTNRWYAKAREFIVCDMKNEELIVHIGMREDVMKWLNVKYNTFNDIKRNKYLAEKRYAIYEID